MWIFMLRRLAVYLERPEMVDGAMQNLRSGLLTLAGGLATLFGAVLVIMLMAGLKYSFARWLVGSIAISTFGGLIKIMVVLREGDSFVGFFLAPTGIPFVFKYYDGVGSMRTVIANR